MTKNYRFSLLKQFRPLSKECINVGYVIDLRTKKPVLFLDVVKDLLKNQGQTCCFVEEREADDIPGEFYALIWIDAMTFTKEILNDKSNGEVMMMHELGHYICGHHKNGKYIENYSKVRKEFDGVMPQELEADEFAIQECGIERFLKFIDKMIDTRKSFAWDKNREKAIKEFKLRREHAIEYTRLVSNEGRAQS